MSKKKPSAKEFAATLVRAGFPGDADAAAHRMMAPEAGKLTVGRAVILFGEVTEGLNIYEKMEACVLFMTLTAAKAGCDMPSMLEMIEVMRVRMTAQAPIMIEALKISQAYDAAPPEKPEESA